MTSQLPQDMVKGGADGVVFKTRQAQPGSTEGGLELLVGVVVAVGTLAALGLLLEGELPGGAGGLAW